MIDLLTEVEQDSKDIINTLFDKFAKQFPNMMIGRPSRFYDTVKRIAAPTRPSLVGPSKLSGSPLVSYRKRIWAPRLQQAQGNGNTMHMYGESIVLYLDMTSIYT